MTTWTWKDEILLREYASASDTEAEFWRSEAMQRSASEKREWTRAERYRRSWLSALFLAGTAAIVAVVMGALWLTK